MTTIYSSAKICPYKKENCDLATEGLSLDPGNCKILLYVLFFLSPSLCHLRFPLSFSFLMSKYTCTVK